MGVARFGDEFLSETAGPTQKCSVTEQCLKCDPIGLGMHEQLRDTMAVKPLLGGRYQFINILGLETNDATYLVKDTHIEGHPNCVIKRLPLSGEGLRMPQFTRKLLRKKAESLQRMGHHGQIPRILAYFEEDDYFCLVEEFIPGRALSLILKSRQSLPETVVIQLIKELLKILVVVHSWGLIHRCITPDNVIQRQTDGKLVLTGLGIFREINSQGNRLQDSVTQPQVNEQQVYASLEHLLGKRHFNGDIYAVGMIGIQALTGLSTAELAKLRNGWRQNGSTASARFHWNYYVSVSSGLEEILNKMVHEDTARRYQTAAEALDAIRQLIGVSGENIPAQQDSRPQSSVAAAESSTLTPRSVQPSDVNVASTPKPPQSPSAVKPVVQPADSNLEAKKLEAKKLESTQNKAKKPYRHWPLTIGLMLLFAMAAVIIVARIPQQTVAYFYRYYGEESFTQGNYQEAIAHYSKTLTHNENGYVYFKRGLAHHNMDNLREAQEDFSQAIQLDPGLDSAYYYRGNIRFQFGDRQGALQDYTEAILLNPQLVKAYVNRGSVRAELGDETGAIEDYSAAIQIDPSMAAAYLNRCLSRSNMEEHHGAIADCTQAINLTPNSVFAYQNRGLVRRRLGDIRGALEDFNIAINLDPEDPDPYYNRGLARLELGDIAGAVEDYTEAINRNPDHALAYYDRGIVRAESGDPLGAIADFQASAKLCLDAGRQGCYEDAKYQISQLQMETEPIPEMDRERPDEFGSELSDNDYGGEQTR